MINKTLLFIFISLISTIGFAQTKTNFGVKAGLNLTFFNVSEANFGNNTETATGYFAGVFATLDLENNLNLQPELLYIGLNDFRFLNAPIYLKYSVNEKFNILIGPSLNYFFDFFNNKFKVRADLGLSYNISKSIDTQIKYTIGFEEITPNGLFIGFGYKL